MGTGLSEANSRSADPPGLRPGATAHASRLPAHVPPHAELPLIRAFVESLRQTCEDGEMRREAPATLRRTVETLAAILDLHGEFGAADEARAILAGLCCLP